MGRIKCMMARHSLMSYFRSLPDHASINIDFIGKFHRDFEAGKEKY